MQKCYDRALINTGEYEVTILIITAYYKASTVDVGQYIDWFIGIINAESEEYRFCILCNQIENMIQCLKCKIWVHF